MSQRDDTEPVGAGGVTLAVRRLGVGPRLVAVHGGPGFDHHVLLPLAEALASRYQVWLPDLPGHGASPPLEGDVPGLREVRDRLADWLAALPGRTEVLAGHSLGAWLVREALRTGRVRPARTVLISPPAGGSAPEPERTAIRATATVRRPRDFERRRAAGELEAHLDRETRGVSLETIRALVGLVRVRETSRYLRLGRELARTRRTPDRPFVPPCPVLVLCGGLDRTTPPEDAQRVTRATSGARLVVLPELGHYPFLESPEAVAGRI